MDELNALPYLDMVVRETLRVYPPVPSSVRVPTKDDVIPLGTPFTDRSGEVLDSVKYALPSLRHSNSLLHFSTN